MWVPTPDFPLRISAVFQTDRKDGGIQKNGKKGKKV